MGPFGENNISPSNGIMRKPFDSVKTYIRKEDLVPKKKDYAEFEKLRLEKWNLPAWDFPDNPHGFPPERLGITSDISGHLEFIRYIAGKCDFSTEFGTRGCNSLVALLWKTRKKVTSYDLNSNETIRKLQYLNKCGELPTLFEFVQRSTVDNFQIESTDCLLIDTLHTCTQVRLELRSHAQAVRKYLLFHDSESHGKFSRDIPGQPGITLAIEEFLESNPEWESVYTARFNHGLTLLEKNY